MDLTQATNSNEFVITQSYDEIEVETNRIDQMEEEKLGKLYEENPGSVKNNGVILFHNGKARPLAFLKDKPTPFRILIGCSDICDIVIPNEIVDGKSGISRKSIFLRRDISMQIFLLRQISFLASESNSENIYPPTSFYAT